MIITVPECLFADRFETKYSIPYVFFLLQKKKKTIQKLYDGEIEELRGFQTIRVRQFA